MLSPKELVRKIIPPNQDVAGSQQIINQSFFFPPNVSNVTIRQHQLNVFQQIHESMPTYKMCNQINKVFLNNILSRKIDLILVIADFKKRTLLKVSDFIIYNETGIRFQLHYGDFFFPIYNFQQDGTDFWKGQA